VFPWVCTCATGSCAISALVGPFDRKLRYEMSPRSDRRSPEVGGRGVRMHNLQVGIKFTISFI
jgi:hypothetical protein